jgi:hypothetical protein
VNPRIAPPARKHGVSDSTIVHGFNSAIRTEELDDDMVMLIGLTRPATSTRSVSSSAPTAP